MLEERTKEDQSGELRKFWEACIQEPSIISNRAGAEASIKR